ncbi:NUDIX hydrolase [Streptomyces sp. B-S-A8]|uniref:NUDIX hydrolase n=1 Tax=Streptomyces solicavernae TaxID=3043614 RepID=A0ABT6RRR8_9ACTN|nr:NUDIX hydrolase [Streptomyces sp. B-S-A8]MDI3387097.1 NUDIX hydrolase [Streptomyces sp. B-S-A8]
MQKELRVAAYAVCTREGQVLLARLSGGSVAGHWTLPGGGMEHGEDPYDTVIREAEEETGYAVEPVTLLGVDSIRRRYPRKYGTYADFHALRLVYEGRITGGTLRHEQHGSTNLAAWHDLAAVGELPTVGLVDAGLRLWRATGGS